MTWLENVRCGSGRSVANVGLAVTARETVSGASSTSAPARGAPVTGGGVRAALPLRRPSMR